MSDEVTAIVPATRTSLSFDEVVRLGTFIAKSGLFGIRTPEQAIALMMIASAEGRHPALAARDYDIIQGRPTKKAEAMLRDFLDAGGRVQWHSLSDEIADATFSHPQVSAVRITWDMARVQKAGLRGKDMYARFPRQMLRSRCVSEGVRTIWPSATGGMYVPEEAAHIDGEVVQATEPSVDARREQINAEVPLAPDPLEVRSLAQWRLNLKAALAAAQTLAEVEAISGHRRVLDALNTAPETIRVEVQKELDEAHQRFAPPPDTNWPDDPIRELIAEVQEMDLVQLNQLRTDAAWIVRVRDAAVIPPDEDRLNEAIAERKAELQGRQ